MPTAFQERVYGLVKKVPAGRITTYKDLAHALGTKAYQAVGSALNKNPYWPQVPCHRVVASDGSIGGFAEGIGTKKDLLAKEGIRCVNNQIVDFEKKKMLG
ncbi:MAG: MGMT family protein [Nanobdellota archaeon]